MSDVQFIGLVACGVFAAIWLVCALVGWIDEWLDSDPF